jgi:hypothetical protein
MNLRRGFVATLVLVAGIASFASSAAAKPLTKAQFVAQANALCGAAQTAILPAFQKLSSQIGSSGGSPSPQQITAFVGVFAPIVQKQINETRALKPPKLDQAAVTKILKTDQNELNMLKANPQLLGAKQANPFLAADSLARNFGLEDAPGSGMCVKPAKGGKGG